MSDSLKATVIVSVLELMISAKPELLLELEEDELPRLPAVVEPVEPVEPVLLELLPVELLLLELEPLAEIDCPGLTLSSEAIIPLTGAYSFVLASVCSSESTVALAWSTEALSCAIWALLGFVEVDEPVVEVPLVPEVPVLEEPVLLLGLRVVVPDVPVVPVVVGMPDRLFFFFFFFVGDVPLGNVVVPVVVVGVVVVAAAAAV